MISSEISKRLTEGLKQLRAVTEPTTDPDSDSVSYYAEYNSVATEEEINEKSQDHVHQLTFWDDEGTVYSEQDFCYAKLPDEQFEDLLVAQTSLSGDSIITYDNYNQFYQDIAQAAKEWADKPSDKKKISQAIEYVLDTAKTAPRINNKLSDRLKHDEMMRIVSKLVEYTKD